MKERASVTREWADGEYNFSVGLPEWRKIEKQFAVGPYEFLRHLSFGTWKVDYPREIIRLALRAGGSVVTEDGGATDDQRINRLIADYVDDRIFQSAIFAADMLTALMMLPATKSEQTENADGSVESQSNEQEAPTINGV